MSDTTTLSGTAAGLGAIGTFLGITGTTLGALAYDKASSNEQDILLLPTSRFLPRVLVFRPGLETSSGLVFNNWSALYNVLQRNRLGPIQIWFDDTQGSIVIPTASEPWNMYNVTWVGPNDYDGLNQNRFTVITIQEGAHLIRLNHLQGSLLVVYEGTTSACMRSTNNQAPDLLRLEQGAALRCNGTQPFLEVLDQSCNVQLSQFASLQTGNTPCLECSSNVASLWIFVGSVSGVATNTLAGSGTMVVLKQDLTAVISATQPQATALTFLDNVSANQMAYVPADLLQWGGVAPTSVADALDRLAQAVGPVP